MYDWWLIFLRKYRFFLTAYAKRRFIFKKKAFSNKECVKLCYVVDERERERSLEHHCGKRYKLCSPQAWTSLWNYKIWLRHHFGKHYKLCAPQGSDIVSDLAKGIVIKSITNYFLHKAQPLFWNTCVLESIRNIWNSLWSNLVWTVV